MLATRAKPLIDMVRDVMAKPHDRPWKIHGLGVLSADFDAARKYRIQLHSRQFMTPGISMVHSEPYGVTSHVIAGRFANVSYRRGPGPANFITHGEPEAIRLDAQSENYEAGDAYREDADGIHSTHYADGSVALCTRGDGKNATAFWKVGESFVTAKPRKATKAEIDAAVSFSLATWF